MTNTLAQLKERFQSITRKQWMIFFTGLALFAMMFLQRAVAGDGGDEFTEVYERIAGWLDGTPGRIIAALALGFAFFNVMKQNFILAAGTFVACLVLAEGSGIIEAFLGASVAIPLP